MYCTYIEFASDNWIGPVFVTESYDLRDLGFDFLFQILQISLVWAIFNRQDVFLPGIDENFHQDTPCNQERSEGLSRGDSE